MKDWLETFGVLGELPGCETPGAASCPQGHYLRINDESLVVSILSAGTFFGALLAYPIGDRLGRRLGLMFATSIFCIGIGLQLSTKFGAFVAGRVVAGLGVGIISCLVPMYQSECSPKSVRGFIVGLYQWA